MHNSKNQKHGVKLIIPHEQLPFFCGVFLGQIASDERTAQEKEIAKSNYRELKQFLDKEQTQEITHDVDKLFPPDEQKWFANEMT